MEKYVYYLKLYKGAAPNEIIRLEDEGDTENPSATVDYISTGEIDAPRGTCENAYIKLEAYDKSGNKSTKDAYMYNFCYPAR